MKKETLGFIYMMASIGLFSANEIIYKMMSLELCPGQTVLWRSLISLIFLTIYYFFSNERDPRKIEASILGVHIIRGVFGFFSLLLMGYALIGIQVTSFKSVFYLNPLITLLLTSIFLKEKITKRTVKVFSLACCGALFLLTPGSEILSSAGLYAFLSTLSYSLVVFFASKLKDQPPFEGMYVYILACFIGCLLFEKGCFFSLSYNELWCIIKMSLIHLSAFYLFLKSLQKDSLQNLNTIEYTGLICQAYLQL